MLRKFGGRGKESNSHAAVEKIDPILLKSHFPNCRCECVRRRAYELDFDGVDLVIGLGKKPE
jgi:hypothetical protein